MSTATRSDSIASDQLLESVGKSSLAGGVVVVLTIAFVSWYPPGIVQGNPSLSELGMGDPGVWFVLGPILAVAVASTALSADGVRTVTEWFSWRRIGLSYLFAGSIVMCAHSLIASTSSSMDIVSLELWILGAVVLGGSAAISVGIVTRWLGLPRRKRILSLGLVLLLGIAIPTGIGAAIDDPSTEPPIDLGPNDSAEPTDWGPSNESSDESSPSEEWVTLASIEGDTEPPENLTDYEPARVEPLEGEIATPSESRPTTFPISIPPVESNDTDVLRRGAEPIYDRDEYPTYLGTEIDGDGLVLDTFGYSGEIALYVDVVEDGRIIRYQRTIDLSELE